MRLYYETVSKPLLECLQKLMANSAFDDFVLVGGTALSLQLGHRISVDIDLFTASQYGSMNLEEIKNVLAKTFPYIDNLENLNGRSLGYSVYIGNSKLESVKLDLYYTEEFITPILHQDGLRLASLQDIAAMKMQAIFNSKRKKDFWDIHELLEHFILEEMIQYGIQRNPYTLTEEDILNTLYNLTEDSELTNDKHVLCLKGKYWELIIDDLRTTAEQYKKQ
ncbi:MAG: nucleotidyl transferase AbiEii/AbiGii toxin family protein [Bacteroidetes bacterium]|nr:nucleotidyl transferase AbiEii/AbiGii toxin family protein [Bacteroidota bacterium]MCL2301780.1 nucleotidyl transferase AbiEii/AbiGii toxin family protein [Lentimicrobiaceae bacterium]